MPYLHFKNDLCLKNKHEYFFDEKVHVQKNHLKLSLRKLLLIEV